MEDASEIALAAIEENRKQLVFVKKVRLLEKRESQYSVYVFEDVNLEESSPHKYIMCTLLPNWDFDKNLLYKGVVGYLNYKYAEAGSSYYNSKTKKQDVYNYSAFYFINFLKDTEKQVVNIKL